MGREPITVEVAGRGGVEVWTRCDQLSDHGPNDKVYTFDLKRREVRFGNGVNGRIPDPQSQVIVTYSVSDGEQGNLAPNRRWRVPGFGGVFGINLDAIAGGTSATGLPEHRRQARHRLQNGHPLVTERDIVDAAMSLPFLGVSRAWVVSRRTGTPDTGTVTLIAMRGRPIDVEAGGVPESRAWLGAVRRSLAGRMLLGSRLIVMAPRYVTFTVRAVVEAQPAREPGEIVETVRRKLRERLALSSSSGGVVPRQPGVGVTINDLKAWILATDGVSRVLKLNLIEEAGRSVNQVRVPKNGLPNWDMAASSITVNRPGQGGLR
jgi:predicted phage baseplate assembly protein